VEVGRSGGKRFVLCTLYLSLDLLSLYFKTSSLDNLLFPQSAGTDDGLANSLRCCWTLKVSAGHDGWTEAEESTKAERFPSIV